MKKYLLFTLLLFVIVISSCEKRTIKKSGHELPTIELIDGKAHVNGTLGKIFYKELVKFLEENPHVTELVLGNIPGSVNDEWNIKACTLVHDKGMSTHLTSTSVISSGGVDLFIAGNPRTRELGAQVGVHSWEGGGKEGKDFPQDHEAHQIHKDYFEKIGMDIAFYWFTLEMAPADDMYWMTEAEMDYYF